MKRFAAHYLYIPGKGFYKQFVVEIREETVQLAYPLEEELGNVSWYSGVILLAPLSDEKTIRLSDIEFDTALPADRSDLIIPIDLSSLKYAAYLLTPFDFSAMRPVAETQRILLR